jgi:hypothetical protein
MKKNLQPYAHNFWVGLSGFSVGGIIGALATFIIFNAGLMSLVSELTSAGQAYARLLVGILIAFAGIALGGAIDGLICGYTLYKIDPEGNQKRYLLGGAYSMGISQGILVIPILVFISLLNIYNVGSQTILRHLFLFTLVGVFGLVNGSILS